MAVGGVHCILQMLIFFQLALTSLALQQHETNPVRERGAVMTALEVPGNAAIKVFDLNRQHDTREQAQVLQISGSGAVSKHDSDDMVDRQMKVQHHTTSG